MRLDQISWKKAEAYFKTHDTVILAVGSIECHGKHNALGTDTLIPAEILKRMEARTEVLIAPEIPYGATDTFCEYPGTVSLGPDGLHIIVTKVTDALYKFGARKFIFLNGHGGNIATLESVAVNLNKKGALGAVFNWWLIAGELNPAWKGGHGGGEETSGLLAIDETLVDWDAIEDSHWKDVSEELPTSGLKTIRFQGIDILLPRSVINVTDNGWAGADHPRNASVQWGNEMLDRVAEYFADFVNAFCKVKL